MSTPVVLVATENFGSVLANSLKPDYEVVKHITSQKDALNSLAGSIGSAKAVIIGKEFSSSDFQELQKAVGGASVTWIDGSLKQETLDKWKNKASSGEVPNVQQYGEDAGRRVKEALDEAKKAGELGTNVTKRW